MDRNVLFSSMFSDVYSFPQTRMSVWSHLMTIHLELIYSRIAYFSSKLLFCRFLLSVTTAQNTQINLLRVIHSVASTPPGFQIFFFQVFYITYSPNSSAETSRSITHTGKNQVCPLCNCKLVLRAPYATVTYRAISPHLYATAKYNAFQSTFSPIFIPTDYNLHLYLIPPKWQNKTLFIKKDTVFNDFLKIWRWFTYL